jgi:hypothetical protein
MAEGPFLAFENLGIAGVLRTQSLSVPAYQRSYSWKSVEDRSTDLDGGKAPVDEYWIDLKKSYDEGNSYFLGALVLSDTGGENSRKAVLDGQQRLATSSILLAAIRDYFEGQGESSYANSIGQSYVGKFDRAVGEDLPIIILNTEDRAFFERVVVKRELGIAPACESQRLIAEAYQYFEKRVDEFCSSAGANWKEQLNEFVNFLDTRAQVILISVNSEADAFLIFETLNDRGVDLTIADLLKNFLFSRAGSRLEEVKRNWTLTLSNLDASSAVNSLFTLFVRHYMSSKHGVVRERELYKRIKSEVTNEASAVAFSADLDKNSRLYSALNTTASDVWSPFNQTTRDAVEVLAELNLERYRPMLLAALAKFGTSQVETLMPTMVAWSIRAVAAGKMGGGVAETAFSGVAKQISDGVITTVDQILADPQIDSLIPSDAEFVASFSQWRVPKGSLARYLLRALELQQIGDPQPELVVNPNVEQVNLEHILPKGARPSDWPRFTPEEQRLYVYRIGNMVLLRKNENNRIGNKSWTDKKPVLASSSLKLTSDAAPAADWTTAEIDARQLTLANMAALVWPRNPF